MSRGGFGPVVATLVVLGAAAAFVLSGPQASAEPTCRGLPATIVGTSGPDTLHGTPGRDVIVAFAGDDVIFGRGGPDLICAGSGDDVVRAGPGDDAVFGGSGDDRLLGQEGDDRLFGQDGSDHLVGGDGSDRLIGGDGDDRLVGRVGPDSLFGGPGADSLYGGGGPDELFGGPGPDELFGGKGPDSLFGGPDDDILAGGPKDDACDGGGGNDTLIDCETGSNSAPTANDDTFGAQQDTLLSEPAPGVLANDTDDGPPPLTATLDTDVSDGTLTLNADGSFAYTPDAASCGPDTFTYVAEDGGGLQSSPATVTIEVNCAPAATGETFDGGTGNFDPAVGNTSLRFANTDDVTTPNVFISGDLLDNDTDADGPGPLSIDAFQDPSANGGDVTVNTTTGEFRYEPPVGFEGTDTFTYTIDDGGGGTDDATVTIEVAEVVWFIDGINDGAGDDGRSTSPFDSIAQFEAENGGGNADDPAAGDIAFVFDGGATYSGPLTLEDDQSLFGQPHGLVVNSHTLVTASGSRPVLSGSSGTTLTLASGNTVEDIDVVNTAGAGLVGSSVGNLAVDDVSVDTMSGIGVSLTGGSMISVDIDAVTVSSSSTGGVHLANHSGTTTFGTLDLTTSDGAGLFASTAGALTVTDAASTIDATGGPAVNITNTTIGASGVTFESVSANGATNGIVLNDTGTSGGFTVTGDGTNTDNASGGTIQSTLDHGIVATNTQDLSLTSIRIQAPGDAPSEHGILATGLRGTSLLRESTITGFNQSSGDGLRVVNNNVNLTELRIDGGTFSNSDGNDAVAVFAQGTSMMSIVVENQTLFTDLEGDALDIIAGDLAGSTASVDLSVEDADFTNAGATGNGGIQARAANDGTLTGSIINNTFNDTHRLSSTAGVIEIQGNDSGSVNLTVSGNDLDAFNQSGINVVADDASDVTVDVDGNSIDTAQVDRIGVRSSIRNTGATRLTIRNNQIGQTTAMPGSVGTRSPIDIVIFSDPVDGPADDVRVLIDNNQLRANKSSSTSEVMDIFVDDNADPHITVTNNVLTNVNLGDGAEIITAEGSQTGTTLCLDLRANTAANPGGTGDIELVEVEGVFSVEDLANTAANNPSANIVFDPSQGDFSSAPACLTP